MKSAESLFGKKCITGFFNQKIAQYLVKANTESLSTLIFKSPYMTETSLLALTRAL
jgi:hypothetical protein